MHADAGKYNASYTESFCYWIKWVKLCQEYSAKSAIDGFDFIVISYHHLMMYICNQYD